MEHVLLMSPALADGFFTISATWEALSPRGIVQFPEKQWVDCGKLEPSPWLKGKKTTSMDALGNSEDMATLFQQNKRT